MTIGMDVMREKKNVFITFFGVLKENHSDGTTKYKIIEVRKLALKYRERMTARMGKIIRRRISIFLDIDIQCSEKTAEGTGVEPVSPCGH
jgi:hypothetical protein